MKTEKQDVGGRGDRSWKWCSFRVGFLEASDMRFWRASGPPRAAREGAGAVH